MNKVAGNAMGRGKKRSSEGKKVHHRSAARRNCIWVATVILLKLEKLEVDGVQLKRTKMQVARPIPEVGLDFRLDVVV